MSLEKRIKAFVQLGLFLKQIGLSERNPLLDRLNNQFYDDFEELILRQKAYNGWFTKENVTTAIAEIANSLTSEKLTHWLSKYELTNGGNKTVGVIMAGNIPLVGFHDFLCVIISGNKIQAKLSSGDNTLIKKIAEILIFVEPSLANQIAFTDKLQNFDAVIATGSNNTARYFEQYFRKYPHIIRKNRNSVAIINEKDGAEDIKDLGKDVFQYFGLGCRSVSKLYLPKGYRIDAVFESFFNEYQHVTENNKYANNYDYNKAVYLMGSNKLLDNGFILLKEDVSLNSPVGVLNYEYYNTIDELKQQLEGLKDELQCVVSTQNTPIDTLAFGEAQCPTLSDYADGIDTIQFLQNLI